jgi:hypothetical protein
MTELGQKWKVDLTVQKRRLRCNVLVTILGYDVPERLRWEVAVPKVCIHKSYSFSHYTVSKWSIDGIEAELDEQMYNEYIQVKGAYEAIQDVLKRKYREAFLKDRKSDDGL